MNIKKGERRLAMGLEAKKTRAGVHLTRLREGDALVLPMEGSEGTWLKKAQNRNISDLLEKKQLDRQTNGQTKKQAGKQTNKQIDSRQKQ